MAAISLFNNKTKLLSSAAGALYFAIRDPRTPFPAKLVALGVVIYAFSPIDFIPDFIPFIGWIDDVVIIGLGLRLARYLIPARVWEDSLLKAAPVESYIRTVYKRFIWTLIAIWITVVLAAAGVLAFFVYSLVNFFRA